VLFAGAQIKIAARGYVLNSNYSETVFELESVEVLSSLFLDERIKDGHLAFRSSRSGITKLLIDTASRENAWKR
ncbi:MAG: hypothetical protein WCP55_05605, partial [Lentisphaerota bacterium]